MNFKKIIDAMENLNSLHQRINEKFSPCSKGPQLYKSCLRQDEEQDLRIYGRTHKDTIRKFKSLQQRKSCDFACMTQKVLTTKQFDFDDGKDNNLRVFAEKRSKTAHIKKNPKRRSQRKSSECFLTAENIFYKQLRQKNNDNKYNTVSLVNNKPEVILKSKEIKRKSIANFKKQFHKSFSSNIQVSKRIYSSVYHITKPKTFINSENILKENRNQRPKVNNFFTLTQEEVEETQTEQRIIKDQEFKQIFTILNQHITSSNNKDKCFGLISGRERHQERFRKFLTKFTSENKCILLCGKKLDLYEVSCTEETIVKKLTNLLKEQKLIHLYFLQGSQVIYEELVLSVNWSKNCLVNSLQLMKFFFKRFACLQQDNLTNKADTLSNVEKFFKNLAPLPTKFSHFLHSIEAKNVSILSFRQNIREIKNIKILLIDAMRHLELQELEEHQKATKLRNDRKGKFYFYICFFVIWRSLFAFQCDHNFDRQHNFFVKFVMDNPSRPSFSKRLSINTTLPGTPHNGPLPPSEPISCGKPDQVLEWLTKKGIKTMVNPQDFLTKELDKKKHEISEGRQKVEVPSTLLKRRALIKNLTLKI